MKQLKIITLAPKRLRSADPLDLPGDYSQEPTSKFIERFTGENFEVNEKYTAEDYQEYLQRWLLGSVTLQHWVSFQGTDLSDDLKQFNLDEKKIDSIRRKQLSLYDKLKHSILLGSLHRELDSISSSTEKMKFAKKQLQLLKKLGSPKLSPTDKEEISIWFGVTNFELTCYQMAFIKDTKRFNFTQPETFDIHEPNHWIFSEVLLLYKDYLLMFLKKIIPEEKAVSFRIITSYKNRLGKLYKELCRYHFINEDETSLEDFKRILKSKDSRKESGSIVIKCDNKQAYHILKLLSKWFVNLSFGEIERSKKFVGKTGKMLTANQLSSAGSTGKEEPKEMKNIIAAFEAAG